MSAALPRDSNVPTESPRSAGGEASTHGRVTVSIENSIRYPAPVAAGDVLTATAVEEGSGRRLAFFNVTVRKDDGKAVGLFRDTVYRTARDHFEHESGNE